MAMETEAEEVISSGGESEMATRDIKDPHARHHHN